MRRLLLLLILTASPALAANERALRNAAGARAQAYRQAVLNAQWQAHLGRMSRSVRWERRPHPVTEAAGQNQRFWQEWFNPGSTTLHLQPPSPWYRTPPTSGRSFFTPYRRPGGKVR